MAEIKNENNQYPEVFENDHEIIKQFRINGRKNREFEDEVELPDLKMRFRMQMLSHDDVTDSQKASGTSLHRSEAVQLSSIFEIVVRSVTHINGVAIENLFNDTKTMPKNTFAELRSARSIAREHLRIDFEENLTTDHVAVLASHYNKMTERRNQAMEKLNSKSKNS